MGKVHVRPMRREDLATWARLIHVVASTDGSDDAASEEDLAERLAFPDLDLDRDTRVAMTPDGEMIGYALVSGLPSAGQFHAVALSGAIHPAHRGRGLGRRLFAWQQERGAQLHREQFPAVPGLLMTRCPETAISTIRLYEAAGLQVELRLYEMQRYLVDDPLPAEPLSFEDLALMPVEPAKHLEEVRRAHNDAFRDHWGFAEWGKQLWQTATAASQRFRPDLSAIAVAPTGRVAAYVLSYDITEPPPGGTGEPVIELRKIGTRRAYRGRGLASALMSQAMHASRAAGYARAVLIVDANSATGAVGVYERLGFVVRRRYVRHARRIAPHERRATS